MRSKHWCLFFLTLVMPTTSLVGQEMERLLLPLVVSVSWGANGSMWTSEVFYRSEYDGPTFVGPLAVADYGPPSHVTIRLPLFLAGPDDLPGQFIYVSKAAVERVHLSVRVRDLSRSSLGVDLPAIRDSAFSADPIEFLNVPTGPNARLTLRIYETEAQGNSTARVQVFRLEDDLLVSSTTVSLRYQGLTDYSPGYAQLAIPNDPTNGPLRVEVTGSGGIRLWAFITATNDATSEIVPLFPH